MELGVGEKEDFKGNRPRGGGRKGFKGPRAPRGLGVKEEEVGSKGIARPGGSGWKKKRVERSLRPEVVQRVQRASWGWRKKGSL